MIKILDIFNVYLVQKDNDDILVELTSKTNKELFATKKFVSVGYYNAYEIKNGNFL